MGAKVCHKWVPRRVTNGYVHNRHVACASCARSGTRLQKGGGLTHLRDGVQVPAAPQCLFAGISIRDTGCGEKNKEQDAQRRGLGKRIRNRVFSAVDWGKKEPDFRCHGLGKRTRNRVFNDTDFRKEKRKLARFLKEM